MGLRNQSSRRRTLKRIGAAMGVVWLAGCSDGGGPEDDNGTDGGADDGADGGMDGGTEDGTDGGTGNETDGAGNETDGGAGNETDGAGNESDGGDGGGTGAIEPGTSIEFSAQTTAWVGIAPDSIADEENPTITLQSGETYEIGWTEGDGASHNIEIWDENDEVVNDLSTEIVSEPEDQWLEFEASDEMASYVCQPHQTTMIGEISVE